MYNLIPWNLYIHFPIRYLLALWLAVCLFSEMWLWHFLVCVTFYLYCYILNQSFGWTEMARCNPFDPTCVCSVAQVVSDFDSILYVACQAPLSMGFSKQEDWSGLPFPFPGNLLDPGIELVSPALAGRFFTTAPPEKPRESHINNSLKEHSRDLEWFMFVLEVSPHGVPESSEGNEHSDSFSFLLPAVPQQYSRRSCRELRNYKGRHSASYRWSCLYDQHSIVGA